MEPENLEVGEARQTGRFVYHVAGQLWEWDDDVYTIHGYAPGEVEPTMDLILQHKHEQDRERVEETLQVVRAELESLIAELDAGSDQETVPA